MQVVGNHSCHSYFNWLKYNIIRGLPHCICELSRVLLKYTWETSSIFRRPYEIFRICQKMTEDFQRFPSCSPDVLITLILPFMYMFPQLKIRERTIWLKTAFLCVIGIFCLSITLHVGHDLYTKIISSDSSVLLSQYLLHCVLMLT